MKKIMIVDDSALMRRVESDILTTDGRFEIAAIAKNGREALEILEKQSFDVILLDINMPIMDGLTFMEEINKRGITEKVVIILTLASGSTLSGGLAPGALHPPKKFFGTARKLEEGGSVTIRALELGAVDFIQKPDNAMMMRDGSYVKRFIEIVEQACEINKNKQASLLHSFQAIDKKPLFKKAPTAPPPAPVTPSVRRKTAGSKLVAIASSTGGPGALQRVIPYLPGNLDAPILLVQHMPKGFTKSLADRLNSCSSVSVKEAEEGDVPEKGHVYIARGGSHMVYGSDGKIHYTDEPAREGVKPCANYMYESLCGSAFSEILCVVLTGMGQDGMVGIRTLKQSKNIFTITQTEETCSVYGMPKAVDKEGLSNRQVALANIAHEISTQIGVTDGSL